jgi:hypothetical protein
MDLSAQDVELRGPGTVSLSQFPTISDWADLRVGYFAVNETTFQNWFATTQPDAPEIGPSQLLNFENGALTVWQKYSDNEIAPGIAQVSPPTDTGTYDTVMNLNSGVPGAYAGFNRNDTDGESVLDLLFSLGYVDMYLYHFNVTDLDRGPDTNTDWTAIIRIMADGSTILNPSSGQNQPPVANDDTATTTEDTTVTINVVANDTDGDGTIDGSTVTIVTHASDGSTFDNGDGTVTYTPDPGFTGSDAFTYTVEDNGGAVSNEATVTVEVTAGNQPPVANDDTATTSKNAPVTINVVANDIDGDGTIDETTVSIVMGVSDGSTFDNGNGTVTYTPDTGFTGTDTFSYTVNDNDGATSNEATVTVEVTAGNQPPVANDDAATTSEDTPVDINLIGNDTDIDGTIDGATVSIVTDAQDGTTFDNADGTVTYTPETGFAGTDTFTYTVQDNEGAVSNEATVSVHVVGGGGTICSVLGDDPRPLAPDMDEFKFTGTEGETVTVTLESNPPEYGVGQRAVLIIRNLGRGLRLFKRLNDELPLEMTVTLPMTGDYQVKVLESPGREVIWGQKYKGDYCVTLEASPETVATFVPDLYVE